jgi:hypothetical protein
MSNDPRLRSVHLQLQARRDDFRRAREALIGACGQPTMAADRQQLDALQPQSLSPSGTLADSRQYWLVDRDLVHSLKIGLNTIGRMPDNDVSILDSSVSRRHAAILVHLTDGCELHDTASKNGTFLNGQRIAGPTPIKAGDEIRLCDRTMIFGAGAQAPAPDGEGPDSKTVVES